MNDVFRGDGVPLDPKTMQPYPQIKEEIEDILKMHDSKRELNKPDMNRYYTKRRLLELIKKEKIAEWRLLQQATIGKDFDMNRAEDWINFVYDRIKELEG